MNACPNCGGLVPWSVSACPHCHPKSNWTAKLRGPLAFLGAGATLLTLSACYGSPCAAAECYGGPYEPCDPDAGLTTNCQYDPCSGVTSDGGSKRNDPAYVNCYVGDAGNPDAGKSDAGDGGM
jgi:hypothetical protein